MNIPTNFSTISSATRALIYCRVSTTKQVTDGSGLESQEARCREHAAAKGYDVAAVFPDDVTGTGDYMQRAGMVALLAFIDAQPQERFVVIFDDLKRLSRNTSSFLRLREVFRLRGVEIDSLNFRMEDTPEGVFIQTIVAAQGQREAEQNKRQTCQKMAERVKAGFWVFYPPLGYEYKNLTGLGKVIVPKPDIAPAITHALEAFASGRFQSEVEIRRFFEAEPNMPKGKNSTFYQTHVTRMLRSVLYAGHIEYPKWGISRRKAAHEGLVSLETFEAIQARREGRAITPARNKINEDFVLRGAACCAECGTPYRSAWSKGKYKHYAY